MRILLVRHSDPKKLDYGRWVLPAGKAEPGESPEGALRREIMEEAGVEIRVVRKLVEHRDPYTGDWLLNFLCIPSTSRVRLSSELAEAAWYDEHEIQGLDDMDPGLKRFLIEGLKAGAFRSQ